MERSGLDRNFTKLWAALTVSLFGSEITLLALPLFAAIALGASPFQMGLLAAVGQLPYLLWSLIAGVIVDRVRRKRLLVACDVVSAVALVTIPLAQIVEGVGFLQLCVVSFVVRTAAVFTEIAHYAYVPTLVRRSRLTEVNSKLQFSSSVAKFMGPGAGGLLVQILTAPFAVLLDAVSFVVSALTLRSVDHQDPVPEHPVVIPSIVTLAIEGIQSLLGHRLLRPIVLTSIVASLFDGIVSALFVIYATRELGMNASMIGLVFLLGGLGALPGAVLAKWVGQRIGVGPAIALGLFGSGVSVAALPLVRGSDIWVLIALGGAKAVGALAFTIANIHQLTLRQTVTSDRLAGRVTAAQRFLVYGSGSIGALVGGILGGWLGLRGALVVCAVGAVLAPTITLFSPVRELRRQPKTR